MHATHTHTLTHAYTDTHECFFLLSVHVHGKDLFVESSPLSIFARSLTMSGRPPSERAARMCQHWRPRVAPLDSMSPVVAQMYQYLEIWATPASVAEGRPAALKMLERQRKAQQEKVDKQKQRFQKGDWGHGQEEL